jgi:Ca-activated chloride channel family protein
MRTPRSPLRGLRLLAASLLGLLALPLAGVGAVEGLDQNDFRLYIDDRPAPIEGVDLGSEAPLSVVYLQDLSGSMANGGKLEGSRRALGALLERAHDGDELALATFAGSRLRIDVPFTGEVATLREAMSLWEGYGTTALHDAVSLLPDISEGGRYGRRVAVLVTDGQDNASALPPAEALDIVRRARLPVYVIGLAVPGESAARGDQEAYRYAELLQSLAQGTGGRYFTAANPEAAAEAVATIVDELRQRYVLALGVAGDGPRSYHRLRVEVRVPYRHTLTYREGYYGTLPPEPARGREAR